MLSSLDTGITQARAVVLPEALIKESNLSRVFAGMFPTGDLQIRKEFIGEARLQSYNCETWALEKLKDTGHVPRLLAADIENTTVEKVLIEGIVLSDLVRIPHERLGIQERLLVVEALAKAIKAAHENGVVLNDVRPANFVLGLDGYVYLIDLNTARRNKQPFDAKNTFTGVLEYMAPELLEPRGSVYQSDNHFCFAQDVFSFGVTAFEVMFGKKPWVAPSEVPDEKRRYYMENPSVRVKEGPQQVQFLKHISDNVASVLKRTLCLAKQRITMDSVSLLLDSVEDMFPHDDAFFARENLTREVQTAQEEFRKLLHRNPAFRQAYCA